MNIMFSRSFDVMEKAMDGLMARHTSISSNLANIDTPGYKPAKVEFEDQLKKAIIKEDNQQDMTRNMKTPNLSLSGGMLDLVTTDKRHFGAKPITVGQVSINAYQDTEITYRNDDNAIDVDTEMAELAKNDMKYETIATVMGKDNSLMKEIIRSSGGT